MSYWKHACALLMLATLANVARADEADEKPADKKPAGEGAERPGREAFRQRLLERFDEDGDGKLSDAEREKAREFHGEHAGEGRPPGERGGRRPDGRGPEGREGRGPEGRGPEGRGWQGRGPDGPGPGGPGRGPRGPEGRPMGPPPAPAELFKKFDADSNDQLSLEEFEKFMGHLRAMGPPPGGPRGFRGPGGPGRPEGGPGPDGRPPRPRGEGEGRGRRGHRDGERSKSVTEEAKKTDAAPAAEEKAEESADDKTT